jgi:hypothetical protein
MNESQDNQNRDNQNVAADSPVWLDRLVDGEIDRDQQRQLLLALETQPDGWRRCALAFVEAQTLRQEFRALGDKDDEASGNAKPQATGRVSGFLQGKSLRQVRWFAMAACFVLAFAIGSVTRGLWMTESDRNLTNQQVATTAGHGDANITSNANAANTTVANATPANANPAKSEIVKMTLPTPDGKSEQTVEVPLVEGSEADLQAMLAAQNPVLSDAALETLQSTGHVVQQRRAFYPVQLQDGRQGVVPVDLVEVRDTGGWQ